MRVNDQKMIGTAKMTVCTFCQLNDMTKGVFVCVVSGDDAKRSLETVVILKRLSFEACGSTSTHPTCLTTPSQSRVHRLSTFKNLICRNVLELPKSVYLNGHLTRFPRLQSCLREWVGSVR